MKKDLLATGAISCFFLFLKYFLLIMLLQFSQFSPFIPPPPCPPNLQHQPRLSSCPWVVHRSSLIPLFPVPFFISSVYFMPTSYASFLYLSPPIPPFLLPTEIPPCDVHFSDSVPVLVVCLVFVFIVFIFF